MPRIANERMGERRGRPAEVIVRCPLLSRKETCVADEREVVVTITHEGMGQGDGALRQRLIGNFLHALEAERKMPAAICLLTEGVRLAVEDSPVLPNLRTLEALGVRILICRTCLDHYGLLEQVAAGTVSNMAAIVAAMYEADSVINL